MVEYVWIGVKFDNVERASIKLLDEAWVASDASKTMDKFIYFFASVGEEENGQV